MNEVAIYEALWRWPSEDALALIGEVSSYFVT